MATVADIHVAEAFVNIFTLVSPIASLVAFVALTAKGSRCVDAVAIIT